MAAIKYSPYIPNIDAWVSFFKNQPLEHKSFYTIGKSKNEGDDMDAVKLISPTQSVVDQAKSELQREREAGEIYPTINRKRVKKVIVRSSSKKSKK